MTCAVAVATQVSVAAAAAKVARRSGVATVRGDELTTRATTGATTARV